MKKQITEYLFIVCLLLTRQECSRVVIRSPDTDVAILCLYNYEELSCDQLSFLTGTGKRQRFIPVHSVVHSLGPDVCKLLPAFHAITGCDSTGALYEHSKKHAFSLLKEHLESLSALERFGSCPSCTALNEETVDVAIKFICLLYNQKSMTHDINNLHYLLCTKKNLQSSKLPPTEDSVKLHFCKANSILYLGELGSWFLVMPSPEGN